MSSGEVVLEGVTHRYPGRGMTPALSGVSLSVERGEFVVIVGPSGCGKSTALRLVAGLDDCTEGTIRIAGRDMRGVPPEERDVAMVFQSYALYPHMTAREILSFPLEMRKVPPKERARIVDETASLLSLGPLLGRRPDELSGGERQRVAMGRAIVRRPRVFLFDEPLANLDAALRGGIRREIGELVRRLGATALYVTHDHTEAMTLADRIVVMRAGRIEQASSPREVYEAPETPFVAEFIGTPKINLLDGVASEEGIVAGPLRFAARAGASGPVRVGLRPEAIRLAEDGVEAKVVASEPLGAETHLVVEAAGLSLRVRVDGFSRLARGDTVRLSIEGAIPSVFAA